MEETSSTSSTSTFDSANIPYIDTSDDAGQHPVPPPRKPKRPKKPPQIAADRLIGQIGHPPDRPPDRLIGNLSKTPVPAPRRKASKENPKPELSSQPLITLDSPENNDNFDPFSSPNSSTVGRVEELRDLLSSPENSPSRKGMIDDQEVKSDLYRTPAFRKAALENPKRDSFKPDISPSPERNLMSCKGDGLTKNSSANELHMFASFDPLISDKNTISETSQTSDQEQSDLIHDWNIHHLNTGASTSSPTVAGGKNSPGCREPVGVTNNPFFMRQNKPAMPPRPKTVIGPSTGASPFRPVAMANPFYAVHQSSSDSNVQGQISDPFSDLLDISINNRKSQDLAQAKWEKF